MFNESIKPPTTSDKSYSNIKLLWYQNKSIFWHELFKTDRVTFNHGKIVNIYIVYKITKIANINGNRNSNLTVQNALFGAVSLTSNADVDIYKYSGYGIAFDRRRSFSFQGGG